MQFPSSFKTIGDISINDVSRAISRFLSLEGVMKMAFIVLSAGLLTVIVTQSGTSYTPTVDVFAYSLVYSSWVTTCLPWLVQNMNGKLLGMLIGVLFRLFAVDAGVLAWSAIRGHRNLLQRGLRMRPLFEPSMSWLAEAGYNLRYGVLVSAVVASGISLMIDYYEKLSQESNARRRSTNHKRGNATLPSAAPRTCDPVPLKRNLCQQCHPGEWSSHSPPRPKISKLGTTVHFDNSDGRNEHFLGSLELENEKREYNGSHRWLNVATSDADSMEDITDKDLNQYRLHAEDKPTITQSSRSGWKDGGGQFLGANILDSFEARAGEGCRDGGREGCRDGGREGCRDGGREGCRDGGREGCRDGGRLRLDNLDRLGGADLEEGTSLLDGRVRPRTRGKRAESASQAETNRGRQNMGRLREGCARRDHISSEAKGDKREPRQEALRDALNESFQSLKKLRGKM